MRSPAFERRGGVDKSDYSSRATQTITSSSTTPANSLRPNKTHPFRDGRSAGNNWRYRGTITREQWLLTEMRTVAQLRLDGLSGEEILTQNLTNNYFQYPTERELASVTKACLLRLDNLSDDPALRTQLTSFIAHGPTTQSAQTNLYAFMRTYRVAWEFMLSVIGPKFQTVDLHLAKHEITAFLENLRTQSGTVAGWSDATLNKIRQVLTKCLAQTGYLASVRSTELRPILLDLELEGALRANGDEAALPAFACLE